VRAPDFVLASEAYGALPRAAEGPSDRFPFGANLAIRARVFEELRFDEAIGPGTAESYAQGSEYELLTRLHRRGERFVHVPDAEVRHVILAHQVELDWLYGRAERIGRGSARIKRKRVPQTVLGWIPLFLNLGQAKWRAHRARSLDLPEHFRIAQRVHYWRGYIAESRILRADRTAVGNGRRTG
jgi:GT2 family glycosyltransferase